ncbi:hypothetical protein EDC04DRAFT_2604711 [Pisolithus marmoratus]|nr:hypothetical protein EDC04DRAFT_2604711 [Pisolithus marmoratus]
MDEPEQPFSDMYDRPIHPLRLPRGQDTSLAEWVPYREIYLSVLHDMEAPPNPRASLVQHVLHRSPSVNPFHKIEKWAGTFFEDYSLRLVGFNMHLGHGGKPCPHGGYPGCNISPSMEDEWEDMDTAGHPPHLARPEGHSCLTIVNVNGVHYCDVWYCNCDGAEGSQLQLLRAGLFPVTMRDCKTSFTFHVLDDFLQDNVECGTSAMNYYSKIQRMTSSTFPHLVPDRYRELLRVSRAWRNLKLLKWKGSYPGSCNPDHSGLVLFCPTCPQPGINIPEMDDVELSQTHAPKDAGNETWLMDGQGYMVASQDYKTYLGGRTNKIMGKQQVNMDYALVHVLHHEMKPSHQNLGHQIATDAFLSIPQGIKIQPGIGIWHVHGHKTECFTRYAPNFMPSSGNVDGKIMETLWSTLNDLLDFQMNDSNFLKMIRMHESNNYIQATCWTNPTTVGALQKKYKAAQTVR